VATPALLPFTESRRFVVLLAVASRVVVAGAAAVLAVCRTVFGHRRGDRVLAMVALTGTWP
jgi:hypothetical protein